MEPTIVMSFQSHDFSWCAMYPVDGRWMVATDGETGKGYDKQKGYDVTYRRGKRNERPNVGGVSIRSRNGAPSRKRCVVNGHMTKASNKSLIVPPPLPSFGVNQLGNSSPGGGVIVLRFTRYMVTQSSTHFIRYSVILSDDLCLCFHLHRCLSDVRSEFKVSQPAMFRGSSGLPLSVCLSLLSGIRISPRSYIPGSM